MTSKKSSKKIEEKVEEKKEDAIETPNTFDPEPVDKAKEGHTIESKEESQKVISKKVSINRYLTKQGLGQNAIRQIFVLFDELSKL